MKMGSRKIYRAKFDSRMNVRITRPAMPCFYMVHRRHYDHDQLVFVFCQRLVLVLFN